MKPRRLDQILSRYGYCTRKEAPRWLRKGRVTTRSGEVLQQVKQKADPLDLLIDEEPIDHPDGYLLMLHKPRGYVCSHTDQEGSRVFDLLPQQWLHRDPPPLAVGRLDRDTTGLLLISDRGELVHQLSSPKSHLAKVYEVTLDRALDPKLRDEFAAGTLVLEGETKPCKVAELEILGSHQARITLWEGRYHQVKRMFGHFGYGVVTLHRSQFGDYHLGDVALGDYQVLPLPSTLA